MPWPRRELLWLFRNRRTGRLTVVQWPNIPLAAYLLATAVDVAFRPSAHAGTVVGSVASAALTVWAVLEIAWGVNPFRRSLGTVVLIIVGASMLRHLG